MARMRVLAPRIKKIQETYKDDREKLGRATMDLYKRGEGQPAVRLPADAHPDAGVPRVLLGAARERGDAPGAVLRWINDLSARDPYFILPLIKGAAMFGQYKLNPPPPDPIQAKVFMFMPIVFRYVRAVPRGPGALLGHQHRALDPAAVEYQPDDRSRGQGRSSADRSLRSCVRPMQQG